MENLGFLVGIPTSTAAHWEMSGLRAKSKNGDNAGPQSTSGSDSASASGNAGPGGEATLTDRRLQERELCILCFYLLRI